MIVTKRVFTSLHVRVVCVYVQGACCYLNWVARAECRGEQPFFDRKGELYSFFPRKCHFEMLIYVVLAAMLLVFIRQ